MPNETVSRSLPQEVNPRVRGLFLKNLADFQTELARVVAGFVPALVIWRQRKELPALVFRLLRRVQDLRQRSRELGVSFEEMHFSANVAGRETLNKLCAAHNPADVLQAGILVVHGATIAAIEDYLKRNEGVYDSPSAPLLEADRDELKSQMDWAQAALREMAEEAGVKPDKSFVDEVTALCAALPAALREHNARGGAVITHSRRMGALPLAEAKLPLGFHHLEFGPEPLPKDPAYADRERYHAVNFLQEVQAADSCASMLFESPDMPWNYFFDLSRQMWDESRHAMFGEDKLLELGTTAAAAGLSTKAYAMRQTLTPLDRYAALSTQEADAFPGKHAGLKDSVANNDELSAKAWSYDIADETQHVRFGAKWIPVMIEKTGEPRSYEQVKEDACNWRASVLAEVYKPAAATLKSRDPGQ
jgi:hypothetical protein